MFQHNLTLEGRTINTRSISIISVIFLIIIAVSSSVAMVLHFSKQPKTGPMPGMPEMPDGKSIALIPGMGAMPGMGIGIPGIDPSITPAEIGSTGVYAIVDKTLLKYSLDGLRLISKLQIITDKTSDKMVSPNMIILANGSNGNEYLIIHQINSFKLLIIDPKAMKITNKIDLPQPPQRKIRKDDMGNVTIYSAVPSAMGPASYSTKGDVICITSPPNITLIDFVTGKVLGKANLNKFLNQTR